jgi:aryl-alcohol dehydrogenase-like predicted oxidoreductase
MLTDGTSHNSSNASATAQPPQRMRAKLLHVRRNLSSPCRRAGVTCLHGRHRYCLRAPRLGRIEDLAAYGAHAHGIGGDLMENRKIGSLSVSVVGMGCNNFGSRIDAEATNSVVAAALEVGITFFDTANIYASGHGEELLGQALGRRREEVVIATKFGLGNGKDLPSGATSRSVVESAEGSLRRLNTDHIDLYQLHLPDSSVGIDETLGALDLLVRDGKVREIGCSNHDSTQIADAALSATSHGTARFVCVENELSLLQRQKESDLLSAARAHGLAVIPFYPLANGLLTGKYKSREEPPQGTRLANLPKERQAELLSDKGFARVEALDDFARANGHTLLELAMSWLAGIPDVASVIAGATKPEQVRANAASVNWALGEEERKEVDRICAV